MIFIEWMCVSATYFPPPPCFFFYFFFLHVMVYVCTRTFAVFANTFVVLLVLLACAAFMQLLRLMLIGYG